TDDLGRFWLGRLHEGTYTLRARNPDQPTRWSSWSVTAGRTGITLRIERDEDPSVTLRGVVLRASGGAVSSFRVFPLLCDESGLPLSSPVYSFEDAGGRFEISGLEEGTRMIAVQADGFAEKMLEPAFYPNGINDLVIELVPEKVQVDR